jgi:hypothetical protein
MRRYYFTKTGKCFAWRLKKKLINSNIWGWHSVCASSTALPLKVVSQLVIKQTRIDCEASDLEHTLLPLLRGRVFHMTKEEKSNDIYRSGWIYSQEQAQFVFTPGQTEATYGRKRGWVSLFDFSDKKDKDIKEALIRHWFLRTLRNAGTCAYLIVAESACSSLISWEHAFRETGGKEFFIPFVETWYPGDMPIQLVSDCLVVTVHRSLR